MATLFEKADFWPRALMLPVDESAKMRGRLTIFASRFRPVPVASMQCAAFRSRWGANASVSSVNQDPANLRPAAP